MLSPFSHIPSASSICRDRDAKRQHVKHECNNPGRRGSRALPHHPDAEGCTNEAHPSRGRGRIQPCAKVGTRHAPHHLVLEKHHAVNYDNSRDNAQQVSRQCKSKTWRPTRSFRAARRIMVVESFHGYLVVHPEVCRRTAGAFWRMVAASRAIEVYADLVDAPRRLNHRPDQKHDDQHRREKQQRIPPAPSPTSSSVLQHRARAGHAHHQTGYQRPCGSSTTSTIHPRITEIAIAAEIRHTHKQMSIGARRLVRNA